MGQTVISRPGKPADAIPDWLWDMLNDPSNVATSGVPVAGMAARLPHTVLLKNTIDRLLKPRMTQLQQQAEYVMELIGAKGGWGGLRSTVDQITEAGIKLPRIPAGLREALANYVTFKPYAEPHSRREFFRKAAQLPHKARQSARISTAADRYKAADDFDRYQSHFADALDMEESEAVIDRYRRKYEDAGKRFEHAQTITDAAQPAPQPQDIFPSPDSLWDYSQYYGYGSGDNLVEAITRRSEDLRWDRWQAGDYSPLPPDPAGPAAVEVIREIAKTVRKQTGTQPAPEDPTSTALRNALDSLITRLTGKTPQP